jgi:hypothetical protein
MAYDIDCEEFLELVYGEDTQGWIDLPAKVAAHWVPYYVEWPNDRSVTRRIDSCLRDREDLYYSVAMFGQRGRKIEDVLPTAWLWADLDEVHPTTATSLGFLPTVAIESSPGRYQALWRLTKALKPATLEKLNRGLTYALDADRGGWDLTQVLRIPGTRNFKYSDAPMVKLLWLNEEAYDAKEIWAAVRDIVPDAELRGAVSPSLPRKPIPTRAKVLLRTGVDQVVEGERSARLWELECLLAESGLGEAEIHELVWASAWNKWSGTASGRERLTRDIRKAMRHVALRQAPSERGEVGEADEGAVDRPLDGSDDRLPSGDVPGVGRGDRAVRVDDSAEQHLPWIGYSSFMAMAMEEPRWLIENIWTADSHGLIAGEPKTNKTTVALALALSVASGKPFLGQYPVGVTGPVLMVQEENAPWMMQDRLRKLASYYGLLGKSEAHVRKASAGALGKVSVDLDFPDDLPLKLLNNYGFDLALEEHREMLEAEVEAWAPKLLVLDPLYLILGGTDENSSQSLRPFLQWLMQLRYKYGCAVMVVHHFRKQQIGGAVVRPGQRILGSSTLHGWVDSALYLSARDEVRDGWVSVSVEREFRSMAPQKPLELALSMSQPGGLTMEVELNTYSVEQVIRDMVAAEPGITVTKLAEHFKMHRQTMLARIRGGTLGLSVETGKQGRGHSHKVYLNGNGDGSE